MNSLLSRCEGTSWEVADKADVVREAENMWAECRLARQRALGRVPNVNADEGNQVKCKREQLS